MRYLLLTCTLAAALGGGTAKAALNIPSDGSDGALVITANTEIDLSQAITGKWDTNNAAHAGMGVYDPEKWAVVFKYSSVNIGAGATVTFKNHASRAPVVWLVQGNVTINGTVSLDGQAAAYAPWLAEPGPGGFRGGVGFSGEGAGASSGFGPGGSSATWDGPSSTWRAYGGSYGSIGQHGGQVYGNPSLLPLVGGSGGAGHGDRYYDWQRGGGAGGGAMLIATAMDLDLRGSITANGGAGSYSAGRNSGGGSGGGVRLVAANLVGAGKVLALGGDSWSDGGVGRIRIERVVNTFTGDPTPAPSVVTLSDGDTPQIWLPSTGPIVRIVSIGGTNAPTDPRAAFAAHGADVTLPRSSSTAVVVETTNVELASTVKVRVTPRANGFFTETALKVDKVITEDPLVIHWTNNVPVNDGYSAMQVRVVRP